MPYRQSASATSCAIALLSTALPISSARTCRLIFIDAVRGKSLSQIEISADSFEVGQACGCALRYLPCRAAVEFLILFQPQHQD